VTCRPTFGRLRNSTAFLVSGNSQPRRPAPPLRDREVAYLNPWPSIPRISKPDSSFPSVPFYDMYPSKRATAAYPEMPPWPCSKEPQQGPHVPPPFSRSSYLVARGSDSIMHIPRPPRSFANPSRFGQQRYLARTLFDSGCRRGCATSAENWPTCCELHCKRSGMNQTHHRFGLFEDAHRHLSITRAHRTNPIV
jgi:hypothetical protein